MHAAYLEQSSINKFAITEVIHMYSISVFTLQKLYTVSNNIYKVKSIICICEELLVFLL